MLHEIQTPAATRESRYCFTKCEEEPRPECQNQLRHITPLTRRHVVYFCSGASMSMKEIQELGGHLTISQAARYMHLSPSHTSNASERMAQWKPTANAASG